MATAQSAEGIILRKFYLRETSYILIVFTKEFGKIRGVLKGVRTPYPQFAGNFEIFTRCQLLFYKKKKRTLDLITRCEALDFFFPVRKDIERLTYANYFIELVDIVTGDHDINEELYDLLVESLQSLATRSSAKRVSRIFELKLLKTIGLTPRLEECVVCGAVASEGFSLSIKDGGVKCRGCAGGDESCLKVSPGTLNFMRKILASPMSMTSRIKVSREVGKETERVLKRFVRYHVARPVKSLKFLGHLEKAGIC
ncbi:MAG: DNA repair protein RecO [Candidatus Omnitrophota bacterium]|jgi:DNA repair protein RecO (recombination protein O)